MADNLATCVQTSGNLFELLLGHKRLTRRVIEAFPEKELFEFSVAGMRPFADIIGELLRLGAPMVEGVASGKWGGYPEIDLPETKAELLAMWDESVARIEELWPSITAERFSAVEKAFGIFENAGNDSLIYALENEIHHRGQGFVYLRELGIEPPKFYER